MTIPQRFLSRIRGDPSECVLIVGSGLSKTGVRRGGRGLPDWDELVEAMIQWLSEDRRWTQRRIGELRAMLGYGRHLDVAEEFRNAIKHTSTYQDFLEQQLKPDDLVDSSEVHRLILNIGFYGIVSYNFDLVFERHSDMLRKIVYPDVLRDVRSLQHPDFFLKIHGCINRPADHLILTRTDFERAEQDPRYLDIMKTILLSHPILCVGFSMRDPAFKSILRNLHNVWQLDFPPIYVLMLDPGDGEITSWEDKGLVILPYDRHSEIRDFFVDLMKLKDQSARYSSRSVAGHKRITTGSASIDAWSTEAVNAGRDDTGAFHDWVGAHKIEEKDEILSRYLDRLSPTTEREVALFRIAAAAPDRAIFVLPKLLAVGTPACIDLARLIFRHSVDDRDGLYGLQPHALHIRVHKWVMDEEVWNFAGDELERVIRWLLREEWAGLGVGLKATFHDLLARVLHSPNQRHLDYLYLATEHIEGAATEIEKIALAPAYVRKKDPTERSFDQRVVEEIKREMCRRMFLPRTMSPAEMLAQAASLEGPDDEYCPCIRVAAQFLLTDFVHRTHLGLQGSSTLYDPAKAREIVDALASLQLPKQQIVVLYGINHWAEDHRGLGSVLDDSESLRRGLLVPLWWRYSTETRIKYLSEHHRGMRGHFPHWTGQEFLLQDLMGLSYDVDEDFRKEFNLTINAYRDPTEKDGWQYDPRPLQELWRDRELSYELVKDPPIELIRRIALKHVAGETWRRRPERWEDARKTAEDVLRDGSKLGEYVSPERSDYIIDNLLGAYDPFRRKLLIYDRMIRLAAPQLKVDEQALVDRL